jgi:MscS family membrane protein
MSEFSGGERHYAITGSRVRLSKLGANGPEITIFAYVNTRDYNEYLAVAEDLNLRIISIVRDAGTDFAYATTSVIMEKFAGLSPEKQKEIENKVEKMQQEGSMPLPFYPQNWIEPRSDTLSFGQMQKDTDSLSG